MNFIKQENGVLCPLSRKLAGLRNEIRGRFRIERPITFRKKCFTQNLLRCAVGWIKGDITHGLHPKHSAEGIRVRNSSKDARWLKTHIRDACVGRQWRAQHVRGRCAETVESI